MGVYSEKFKVTDEGFKAVIKHLIFFKVKRGDFFVEIAPIPDEDKKMFDSVFGFKKEYKDGDYTYFRTNDGKNIVKIKTFLLNSPR